MKYQLKVYSIWEFGQRKNSQGEPHQEDSLYPPYGQQSDNDRLFILCDGMGGHDAGEVASATVCEAMRQSILNDGHDSEGIFTAGDFSKALDEAYSALDQKDNGAEKAMGTTLAFLKLYDEGAFIAHIGDSRVYHIRPGKTGDDTVILKVTEDHSLINDLIKNGTLTKEEARFSNQKNTITRAMQPGLDRRHKADIYKTSDIKPGDYFYLCSDGMLEQNEMEDGTALKNIFSELGGSDENKIEILKSVTEQNRDNHTAFVIHITDVTGYVEQPVKATPDPDKFVAIVEPDEPRQRPVPGATPHLPPVSRIQNKKRPSPFGKFLFFILLGIAVMFIAAGFYFVNRHHDKKGAEPQPTPIVVQEPRSNINVKKSDEPVVVRPKTPMATRQGSTQSKPEVVKKNDKDDAKGSVDPKNSNTKPQSQPQPQPQPNAESVPSIPEKGESITDKINKTAQGTKNLQPAAKPVPPADDPDVVDSDEQTIMNGK